MQQNKLLIDPRYLLT